MRYSIFIFFFWVSFSGFSQYKKEKSSGLFYKISVSATGQINEDYTINTDDEERLLEPNAFFLNNTFGYQFDEQSSIAINFEYNRHARQALNFFPVYLSFKRNLIDDDDSLFIRGGYGTLVNFARNFEKGNMYKLGIGLQIFDASFRNSSLIGLDFTRKRFGHRNIDGLSSVSLFIEYQFF